MSRDEIVSSLGLDNRGAGMLLDALVPIGILVRHDDGRYSISDDAKPSLTPGKPGYMIPRLLHMASLWLAWGELDESVRTGTAYWQRHKIGRDPGQLVILAEMLFDRNFEYSKRAAGAMGVGEKLKGLRILDVAAGSGAWSIGFLTLDKSATSTAVDFGPVLEMAKRKAAASGVGDRFDIKPGNIREVDFGEGYNLAILGHICHSEGPEHSAKLIKKVADSLASGGIIFIADMIPDDDRRGPAHPLLFALNMLVNTLEGGTFTFSEYREWLEDAGMTDVRKLDFGAPDHSPIILATKPA